MSKKSVSDRIKREVRARFTHCVCCGTWDAYDTGHIVSEKRGGTLDSENLLRMCDRCNGALRSANCRFASYASPTGGLQAPTESNRARWFAYCDAEIKFWDAFDRVVKGDSKINPYKRPAPYAGAE
jgi:hypothetical protein